MSIVCNVTQTLNAVAFFDQDGDRAITHQQALARCDLFCGPELFGLGLHGGYFVAAPPTLRTNR